MPAVRDLDGAVSRVGARGFDADGHQRVVLRGEGEALGDDPAEVLLIEDQVVGRSDDHLGVGVALEERVGRIGDAGRRVAPHGFAENLLLADFGNVLQHQPFVSVVGHHEEVLGGNHLREAFVGVADEGFPGSENVEELFGPRLAAFGPEAGPDAARHDDTIFIARHSYICVKFDKDKNIFVTLPPVVS